MSKNMKNKKIMVGLSGGVDSSVSAYLLQKDGYEVCGVYMKLHNSVKGYHEKNLESIHKVVKFLDIKFYILDLEQKFKDDVYDYFVNSYIDGITPNPCVMCNRNIKFGAMYEFAIKKGCDFLATGHYAMTDGKFIYEAKDKSKDQSYFLGQIKQKILPNIIFPMSLYKKDDIKIIAKSDSLSTANISPRVPLALVKPAASAALIELEPSRKPIFTVMSVPSNESRKF
jgi:tRNA-specific 2-thiouridylase